MSNSLNSSNANPVAELADFALSILPENISLRNTLHLID